MKEEYQHIKPITIGSEQGTLHLLIIAGVHGDEFEPILAVQELVDLFSKEEILIRGKLTLVPIVNIPAHENESRTGVDGKDLARTCPGQKDGTETEQIAWELSELIRSVDFMIDMHTGGKTYEIYPLTGYMLHPDNQVLEKQRAMASAFGLPVQWGTSPNLEGRTLSVARDAGVPAIYTEYGGGEHTDSRIVDALYDGCLRVMTELNMVSDVKIQDQYPQYIIEDHREASGHLQIMYPSPMEGDFKAQANLGEMVKEGDYIGGVQDSKADEVAEIYAKEDGLLFLIRRKNTVKKGEATAGVLPITKPGKITIP